MTAVSRHDEQKPHTYKLQRGGSRRSDGKHMRREGITYLHPTKKAGCRLRSANATRRNHILTSYKEEEAIDSMTMVSSNHRLTSCEEKQIVKMMVNEHNKHEPYSQTTKGRYHQDDGWQI